MKRYNIHYDKRYQGTHESKDGEWVYIKDCIIAHQDNMMLGDPVHGLWRQIQKQAMDTGPYDVMIIMKKVDK